MSPLTFVETLRREVGRMQAMHPEREGELARAHALILQGMVVPSPDDPATAHVLSSDGATHYTVNGSCSCKAGEHGKDCKHQHAWKLFRYVERKVAAQTTPEDIVVNHNISSLPEAPASVNVRLTIDGRDCQLTLRDTDEARLLERLAAVLAAHPLPEPAKASSQAPQGQLSPQQHNAAAMHRPVSGFCPVHTVQMQWNDGKEGRKGWYSHRTDDGWCKGR